MPSIQHVTEEMLHARPGHTLNALQTIVLTGDADVWRRNVPSNLDITGLADASGRNLLHTAMDANADSPAMVEVLVNQAHAHGHGWRQFINQPDHFGQTPRDHAVKFGKTKSEDVVASQSGVTAAHYKAADRVVPKVLYIGRDGQITESALDKLPKEAEWAKDARLRLRRELAEVMAHMPELVEANAKRGGYYAITEGTVSDFVKHVLKQKATPNPTTTATSFVWKNGSKDNLVTVYSSDNLVSMKPHVNVGAHELTHGADSRHGFAKTGSYSYEMTLETGLHSDKPIFKLARELDGIIGGARGISNFYKPVIEENDGYRANPDHEYFAIASNHMGMAKSPVKSPLLDAYQQIVLRPMLQAQRDGNRSLTGYLELAINYAKPEQALSVDVLTHLNDYRTAVKSSPSPESERAKRTAREALLASKSEIEAAMIGYMKQTVGQADQDYKRTAGLKISPPPAVIAKPASPVRATTI